jgi:hypothetical protein
MNCYNKYKFMKKSKLLLALLAILIIGTGVIYSTQKASSGEEDDFDGWVWGEAFIDSNGNGIEDPGEVSNENGADNGGVGWISLSSTNCDPDNDEEFGPADNTLPENYCPESGTAHPYGVKLLPSTVSNTKNLVGYAWSDNFGWIRFGGFGRSDSYGYGTPNGERVPGGNGTYSGNAKLNNNNTPSNLGDDFIEGWVRACSVYAAECTGAPANPEVTGGWDGWISLKGRTNTNEPYGISYSTADKAFKGMPWGGNVIGWLDFQYAALANENPGEPPVNGVCSIDRRECLAGTYNPDPADTANAILWTCNGVGEGSIPSGVCDYTCPGDQILVEGVCEDPGPPVSNCSLSILNSRQTRSVVGRETDTCGLVWSVQVQNFGTGGSAACATGPITCSRAGVTINPTSPGSNNYSTTLPVGRHTITCSYVDPSGSTQVREVLVGANLLTPQCRLNPNYGEF